MKQSETVLQGDDEYFTPFNVLMMAIALLVPLLMHFFKQPKGKRAYITPSNTFIPFIGNALQFHESCFVDFLEKSTFRALVRTGEPNFEAFILGTRYLFIGSRESVFDVMGNKQRPNTFRRDRAFESSWARELRLTKGLFNAENPDWSRIRRLTSLAFVPHSLLAMRDVIVNKSLLLLQDIRRQMNGLPQKQNGNDSTNSVSSIDGLLLFKKFTSNVIFDLAFGISAQHSQYVSEGAFLTDVSRLMLWLLKRSVWPMPISIFKLFNAQLEGETKESLARIEAVVESVLSADSSISSNSGVSAETDKKGSKEMHDSQLIHLLRKASLQQEQQSEAAPNSARNSLSKEEIRAQIWTFLFAGVETTAILLESASYVLGQPHYGLGSGCLLHQLQDEIDAFYARIERDYRQSNQQQVLDGRSTAEIEKEIELEFLQAVVTYVVENDRADATGNGSSLHTGRDTDSAEKEEEKSGMHLRLLSAFLLEVGRLYGPVRFLLLELAGTRPVQIAGDFVISSGEKVVVNVYGMLTDETVYVNPNAFDPHRWLPERTDKERLARMKENYIEFGFGPRICPGQRLANIEATVALAALLHRYDVRLGCNHMDIKFVAAFAVRMSHLPLLFDPRDSRARDSATHK